jgi:hypothetical protein
MFIPPLSFGLVSGGLTARRPVGRFDLRSDTADFRSW